MMNEKPLILLTGGYGENYFGDPCWEVNQDYIDYAEAAGADVLLALPGTDTERLAELADGLILTGGGDICPDLYGQENTYSEFTDPDRDRFEMSLTEAFLRRGKGIFGICRGLQVLNVYFGGTLLQDLQIQRGVDHFGGIFHPARVPEGSFLEPFLGRAAVVNSFHHQAVDRLGGGLVPAAFAGNSEDGLIEAFRHETLPVWAVQWHPERIAGEKVRPDGCADSLPLLKAFIERFCPAGENKS